MKSKYNEKEAKSYIKKYAKRGVPKDLALRIYTTQLLGNDPTVVLHGGGNTSVKSSLDTLLGENDEIIYVKGSGKDMGNIEEDGFPALEMKNLLAMRKLIELDDFQMVNYQRKYMLDTSFPNASVETLLHAFLPHKFVDHSHSNAILSLIDQPNPEKICKHVFGDEMGIVPYIMPGFELAKKYNSLVFVDDCHATGFVGKNGKGSQEENNVIGKIDVITGTLGKALGGGSGGFTSGKKEIIDILRQKSRPYLFSNTLAPAIVGASLKAIDLIENNKSIISKLNENTTYFRNQIKELGFDIKGDNHPIVPVMIYDDKIASEMSDYLLKNGIYVVGFSYPVVPKGLARIRVQISSSHNKKQIDKAVSLFKKAGQKFGVINWKNRL